MDEELVARVFTEWDRRYRENPEKFWDQVTHLVKNTAETYGESAAPYFLALLEEMSPKS